MEINKEDYEYKITMISENIHCPNKTSTESYVHDLDDMADAVLSFVNAIGFTYVEDIEFIKKKGLE